MQRVALFRMLVVLGMALGLLSATGLSAGAQNAPGDVNLSSQECPDDTLAETTVFSDPAVFPDACFAFAGTFNVFTSADVDTTLDLITGVGGTGFVNLGPGSYYLQAPDGSVSALFTIEGDGTTGPTSGVNFSAVVYVAATGILEVNKFDATDQTTGLAGAEFDIFEGLCAAIVDFATEPVFATVGPTNVAGFAEVDLDPGDYCVLESIPPARFDANPVPQDLTIVAGETVTLDFFNALAFGDLEITKLFVGRDPLDGDFACFTIFDAPGTTELAAEQCTTATSDVVLFVDLPVGPVLVVETGTPFGFFTAADEPVTIVSAAVETLDITNDARPTGDVLVTKKFCTGGSGTTIEVTYADTFEAAQAPTDCAFGSAAFEIYPFGDETGAPISFETGTDGALLFDDFIPQTDSTTGPHLIVEVATGAEAEFEVNDTEQTVIEVLNFAAVATVAPTATVAPAATVPPTAAPVIELPDTGAGSMGGIGSSQALFIAGALCLVTFGAAYTWRRRTT